MDLREALDIVLSLAQDNALGSTCQDFDLQQEANRQQDAIKQVGQLLTTVDETCQMGLNSTESRHWEAALEDILSYIRN